MGSGRSSRRKGATFEAQVASWLREHGWPYAERRSAGMDGTDILGIIGWSVECKNRSDVAGGVRDGVDQAVSEADVTGSWPVAVVKRPRRSDVGESYAVMPLST